MPARPPVRRPGDQYPQCVLSVRAPQLGAKSFGMAFIEALFAGIPVLYPAGWAIDGFFDADRIGYACDAHDASDVLRGLKHLLAHEARLKRSIQTLQEKGGLDMFRSEKILSLYNNQLNKALASS